MRSLLVLGLLSLYPVTARSAGIVVSIQTAEEDETLKARRIAATEAAVQRLFPGGVAKSRLKTDKGDVLNYESPAWSPAVAPKERQDELALIVELWGAARVRVAEGSVAAQVPPGAPTPPTAIARHPQLDSAGLEKKFSQILAGPGGQNRAYDNQSPAGQGPVVAAPTGSAGRPSRTAAPGKSDVRKRSGTRSIRKYGDSCVLYSSNICAAYKKAVGAPIPDLETFYLIKGIIEKESGWNPKSDRYEEKLKQSSYGLMHILGTTAKANGHNGPDSELYDPDTNLLYGIRYLAKKIAIAKEIKKKEAANSGAGPFEDFSVWQMAAAGYNSGGVRLNKSGKLVCWDDYALYATNLQEDFARQCHFASVEEVCR